VVLFCALADALLITAGVLGMAQALGASPAGAGAGAGRRGLPGLVRLAGAAAGAARQPAAGGRRRSGPEPRRAWRRPPPSPCSTRTSTWTRCCWWAASARSSRRAARLVHRRRQRASLGWFTAGLRRALAGALFARPRAWQVLDALIGLTMWAVLLIRHSLVPGNA
jgi:L-lysine exporter family protein LysE/ArgO